MKHHYFIGSGGSPLTRKGVAMFMNENNSLNEENQISTNFRNGSSLWWERIAREENWDVVFDFMLEEPL